MNTLLDGAYPRGALYYWKSNFLSELDDDLIDTAVEQFASTPSPMNGILFEHFHGAVSRVGETETAMPQRGPGYNLLIPTTWVDPSTTEENIAWTRATYDALSPHFAEGRWLNYLGDDEQTDVVRAVYGPNYDRLVEVKRRFDPDNIFRLNHNIDPA
jgi:FAD/FMN-containing dehydrogenase